MLTPEPPAATLVRQARAAALAVTGSPGPIALAGLAHDPVSRGVLEAMPSAVLVVPTAPRSGSTTRPVPLSGG